MAAEDRIRDVVGFVRDDEWAIERLHADPTNAEIFEPLPEEEMEALSLSIKMVGMINPIAVRREGKIIAGEQRWRAAQRAGLSTVPVRIYDVDEHQADILRLAENIHRRNLKPSEMTRSVVRLFQVLNPEKSPEEIYNGNVQSARVSLKAIAFMLGYSADHLYEMWARRRLVPELSELTDKKMFDLELAGSLSALPQHVQKRLAEACNVILQSEQLTAEERKNAVRELSERLLKAEDRVRELEREAKKEPEEVVAELEKRMADERERSKALLEAAHKDIERLRNELSYRREFRATDPVYKTVVNDLGTYVTLDPQRVVSNWIEHEGMDLVAEQQLQVLDKVIPWLKQYQEALREARGPQPVSGLELVARRADREVGVQDGNNDES